MTLHAGLFADLDLARRLERAEAISSARFVEAHAHVDAASGAAWRDFAGTYAMFDGADSPITQTFGLGMFAPVTPELLTEIESFFFSRQSGVNHEVSPLASIEVFDLLVGRGYRPVEFTSVMFRSLDNTVAPSNPHVDVRPAREEEFDLWARVSADGWATDAPELREFILSLGKIVARKQDSPPWLAFINGEPVGAAALSLCGPVAHMAGASTIPSARGNGAQLALLQARLAYAAQQGCSLALMGAAPGSASQRNAERHGFKIAYTRQKWHKAI
jgi:GNAT superfamily N-acetyltransferase